MNYNPQELARQFNEDAAIWRSFQQKRLRPHLPGTASLLPQDILYHLKWLKAQREGRPARAVGRWIAP
jgi:hypothetical protein